MMACSVIEKAREFNGECSGMGVLEEDAVTQLEALRKKTQFQRSEGWRPRRDRLRALRRAFIARRRELQAAIATDLGRPETETDLIEYVPLLGELNRAITNLRSWSRPKRPLTPIALAGASSQIIPQPKGVCLILSPWNYPASLALGPLISCIAAGNTAVLKPSEYTPATNAYLYELIGEALEDDVVKIVEGGPDVAKNLLAQHFDHIFFTGSPEIGRVVMAAAAKGPTSVTLELGGKSPAFVQKGANIKGTAHKLVWAKFVNAGQTCIAPDYVLVEEAIAEELKDALVQRIQEVYPLETSSGQRGENYTQIITLRHAERQVELINDAREKGAQPLTGGSGDIAKRFIVPTLLDGITPDMRVAQEEIFGPILPIHTVSDLDEAISHVNAAPPPLASYIFTKDKSAAQRFLTEAPAGGSCVNHALVHFSNEKLPFGGIGPSGIGRSHGQAGFEAFSNMRTVMRDRFSPTSVFFPPYSGLKKTLMSIFLRFFGG